MTMCSMRASMSSALVLDGTPADRALMVTALRSAGVDVLEAARGDEALDLARNHPPDLIIADLSTPEMDRDDFALALRTDPELRETPIVFCGKSQYESELRRLASACGRSHVLIKPFAPAEILQLIAQLRSPRT
jgi:two-component system chemotaxis response regulator CheY